MSATAEPNLAGGFATWGPIIVTDDSGQTPSVASQFSSGDFFAIGMTSVLITYSDAAGNSVSCAFEVTITGEIINNVSTLAWIYCTYYLFCTETKMFLISYFCCNAVVVSSLSTNIELEPCIQI